MSHVLLENTVMMDLLAKLVLQDTLRHLTSLHVVSVRKVDSLPMECNAPYVIKYICQISLRVQLDASRAQWKCLVQTVPAAIDARLVEH